MTRSHRWIGAAALIALFAAQLAGTESPAAPSVSLGSDGKLLYSADARGNTIVDFSHAGYGGGGMAIPDVPARIFVSPDGGRHRARIQAALDRVSRLPAGADGVRGAVVLQPGRYDIDTALAISASGVVLRGTGDGDDGSVLVATGTSRRTLIKVSGHGARQEIAGSRRAVTDTYVPVGSRTLTLENTTGLSVGDAIVVHRPSTKSWIASIGMDAFQGWRPENRLHWQPGSRDIAWDRIVTSIDEGRITIDAPLTTAIEAAHGGGTVYRYAHPGRISHVGIEALRLVSEYDRTRPADEDHAWIGIGLNAVEHAWVRQVTALNFVGSAVDTETDTKSITIEDVRSLDPVSEIGGYRRRAFSIGGELTLVQRCHSQRAQHDYVTGFTAAGPNTFLDNTTDESLGFSGPLGSWASGVLYDSVRIRGHALRLGNRDVEDQGAGWAAANSVLWNCEATDVEAHGPPGAYNRAFGCKGIVRGDGIVEDARAVPYRDYYNFYFQHWLLESRAHYVDFPWRPINTIQATDLPDQVPAANAFYDITHPLRRDLHRRYIRHALDVLGGNANVVFGIDREYTGSLEFLRFWLDEIAAWQTEHGRRVYIALEVPKAHLEAILRDPVRRPMIAAIDIHGWVYRHDGALFAIRGGINQSPREQRADIATPEELEQLKQHLGPVAAGSADFLNGPEFQRLFDELWTSTKPMRARTWREYRDRFPELVMLQQEDEYVNIAPRDGRE